MNDAFDPDVRTDEDDDQDDRGSVGDGTAVLASHRDLLDHSDEEPEIYQIKKIDLRLLDSVSEKIFDLLTTTKNLRPIDKSEGLKALGGIQGIGKEGADFHNLSEQQQNQLLADMYYCESLPQINDKFMVTLDYKPPVPSFAPTGPQFAPTFGPGGGGFGGGGMGRAPQPNPPAPPGYGGGAAWPQQGPPPIYPQAGYPTYPPQPYPGDAAHAPGGYDPAQHHANQAYAQPHPYPSYPVQPPPHPGYPPYHAGTPPWPPHPAGGGYPPPPPGYPPYPPAGTVPPPHWPGYPPGNQPPHIIDAETTPAPTTPETSSETDK